MLLKIHEMKDASKVLRKVLMEGASQNVKKVKEIKVN
jgi:hypothetical protein